MTCLQDSPPTHDVHTEYQRGHVGIKWLVALVMFLWSLHLRLISHLLSCSSSTLVPRMHKAAWSLHLLFDDTEGISSIYSRISRFSLSSNPVVNIEYPATTGMEMDSWWTMSVQVQRSGVMHLLDADHSSHSKKLNLRQQESTCLIASYSDPSNLEHHPLSFSSSSKRCFIPESSFATIINWKQHQEIFKTSAFLPGLPATQELTFYQQAVSRNLERFWKFNAHIALNLALQHSWPLTFSTTIATTMSNSSVL